MSVIPIYRPYVFLRCRKCGRKTDHVLIDTLITEKGEMEETFECQQCGETKKIYELASLMGQEDLAVQELEENVEAKRAVVEQLESKKKDLESKLKEPQNKDNMEVTESNAPNGNQQHEKPEEPQKNKQEKKKRKWF